MPTTPEVNEENGPKNNFLKDKSGKCLFCITLRLCCLPCHRSYASLSELSEREYFYKRNPTYSTATIAAGHLSRPMLFRHSVLHSFTYQTEYEPTILSPYPDKSVCNQRFEILGCAPSRCSSGVRVSQQHCDAYIRYKCGAELVHKTVPSECGRISCGKLTCRKRRNLYDYPSTYYHVILKNLEAESKGELLI